MEALTSPVNLSLLICIILMLVLAFIIYRNKEKKISNKIFFFLIVSATVWIFANLVANLACSNINVNLLLWNRLSLLGPAFLPLLLILFSSSFPENKIEIKPPYIWLLSLATLFIVAFIPTSLNVKTVEIINAQNCQINFVPGPLYTFISIYLFFGIIVTAWILIKKYIKAEFNEKKQIKFILIGLVSSALMGLLVSAVLPIFGYSQLITIGPATTLILIGFAAYAIIKHQLLDIRLIVAETATYLVVIVLTIEMVFSSSVMEGLLRLLFLIVMVYGGYALIGSMHREIEHRKRLQELSDQLAHANAHLKELDAMKTEFVSLASHELLTPVSAIEGYLSMLLDEKMAKVEDPKAQKYMDRVYSSAKRLARLVTDMLNVSRIEEGRLLVEKKEVNLADLIEQVIDELKFKADEKKQKIVFSGQVSGVSELKPKTSNLKPEFMTFGDPDKLKEVLVNLIGNAIKYSKNPGTITVRIEKVPTAWVAEKWQQVEDEIKGRPLDDQEAIKSAVDPHLKDLVGSQQILISVQDQGIGIPREELPRLFKKFHRVGDYTIAESQGTGLGLYISRALVELHHGRIWADSEGPGRGSTFTFSLPDISAKDEILKMEAQAPKPKEQLKPLARPVKEAEEL